MLRFCPSVFLPAVNLLPHLCETLTGVSHDTFKGTKKYNKLKFSIFSMESISGKREFGEFRARNVTSP